jgi:hypothetical protein
LLLFSFSLLFVWLMKQSPVGAFGTVLKELPDFFGDIVQVPVVSQLAKQGRAGNVV